MALFGGKSKGNSSSDGHKSETTVRGSKERPQNAWDGIDSSRGDLADGGVCHDPSNKIEEQG